MEDKTNIQDENLAKSRHGCVTIWLIFGIIAIMYNVFEIISQPWRSYSIIPSRYSPLIFIILDILNIYFFIKILRWKFSGVLGYMGVLSLFFMTNLLSGSFLGCIATIIHFVIFCWVANLKSSNNLSTWEQLK